MINIKELVCEVETDISDFNECNIVKPYAYLRYFSQAAEWDSEKKEINIGNIRKYNLSWVLLSTSVEVLKPMDRTMKLYANTWNSQRRGAILRREFIFMNENDEVMFRGFGFSALFDLINRTIYRGKELPFMQTELNENFTMKERLKNVITSEFFKVDERKVYNSCIDVLGHVNNCRYAEFVYDALADDERNKQIKRMDIYFKSELRNRDNFTMLKAYDGDNIILRGYNDTKSDISFDAVLSF